MLCIYIYRAYVYIYTYALYIYIQSIFCRCSQSLEQSTHRPQDCYLFNGRFQTSLEDLVFQKGLRLTLRLLLLQLFYQCVYYYHYHLRYHYRCHHCYHHHLMFCAIGLYMYCRRHNRNDCFTTYLFIPFNFKHKLEKTHFLRAILEPVSVRRL